MWFRRHGIPWLWDFLRWKSNGGSRAIFRQLYEEWDEIIFCDGIEAVPEGWELNAIMGADDTGVRWVLGVLDHQGISFSNCGVIAWVEGSNIWTQARECEKKITSSSVMLAPVD